MSRKTFAWCAGLAILVIAFGLFGFRPQTAAQQSPGRGETIARYAVLDSDGTNLEVVDNTTSRLYFYTVNPGQEAGADLHLRGSIDLTQVGNPIINAKSNTK